MIDEQEGVVKEEEEVDADSDDFVFRWYVW